MSRKIGGKDYIFILQDQVDDVTNYYYIMILFKCLPGNIHRFWDVGPGKMDIDVTSFPVHLTGNISRSKLQNVLNVLQSIRCL